MSNSRGKEKAVEIDDDQEDSEYEVETIIDKKKIKGEWKYKVKWAGYPIEESTWEPLENLSNVQELLSEFEKTFSKSEKDNTTQAKQKKKKSLYESAIEISQKKAKGSGKSKNSESLSTIKKKRARERENSMEKNASEESPANEVKEQKEKEKEKECVPMEEERETLTDSKKANSVSTGSVNNGPKNDYIILCDEEPVKFCGSFETGDIPKKIITARLGGVQGVEVLCLVEWATRESGIKPAETFISNKVLREKCPNLLLDFYESRLRFPSSDSTNNK